MTTPEFEKKLKDYFSRYQVVDRETGVVCSFDTLLRLMNDLFVEKEKKLEKAYLKMVMDYLHILGAVLQSAGGKYEVKNHVAKNLPETFYITAKKNPDNDSMIYKICSDVDKFPNQK